MSLYACMVYLTLTVSIHIIFACNHYHDPACQNVKPIDGDHFMNQFIAEIKGGEEKAIEVARDLGFQYKKPMKTHDHHYFFSHPEVYDRHKKRKEDILKILRNHDAVVTADQQFVWRPTIRELEEYEDMVGLEEAIEVRTSHFNPDEVEFEGKTAYDLIRPDDVFRDPEPILHDYPPIHTIVDFDKLYEEKNREKAKRAEERRLQKLKKTQEAKKKDEKVAENVKIGEEEKKSESDREKVSVKNESGAIVAETDDGVAVKTNGEETKSESDGEKVSKKEEESDTIVDRKVDFDDGVTIETDDEE